MARFQVCDGQKLAQEAGIVPLLRCPAVEAVIEGDIPSGFG